MAIAIRRSDADRRASKRLKATGTLRVIGPKGSKTITEANVLSTGVAGLADTKVIGLSKTCTTDRFSVPKSER